MNQKAFCSHAFFTFGAGLKKILVIRLSSIGDIVLTSPVLRCLKKQVEGAEVHVLCKESYAFIHEESPYVEKVWTVKDSLSEVTPQLKKEGFDFIVDLHKNIRSKRVISALRGVKSASFPKLNFQKWLLVNTGIDRLGNEHIVDRYFKAAESLGVKNDGKGLDYFLGESHKMALPGAPFDSAQGAGKYLVWVIGGQHAGKRMDKVKILDNLLQWDYPSLILGGEEDTAVGAFLAENANHVSSYCGKLSFNDSAAVIRDAHAVISHDTGLMHVAAAFKKDILSLWGQTTPRFGMYPYMAGENSLILEPERKRSLSKLGNKGFSQHPMLHIADNKIVAWVKERFES
jgi:ADP-heptose:LPS heptosyltransferase